MDTNEIWHDATPDSTVEAVTVAAQKLVSEDIILTVAGGAVPGGVLDLYCLYYPLGDSTCTAV